MKKKIKIEDTFRVEPPKEVFMDNGALLNRFEQQSLERPIALRCDYPAEGGMLLWFEGFKYPHKGFPYEQAIRAIDPVKRATLAIIRFLSSKPMRYLVLVLFFMPFREKLYRAFLHEYVDFTDRMLKEVYLKPQFCCVMVREIHRVLIQMNLDRDEQLLASAICMFLEWDDAYRIRVQSLFSHIVDKEAFMRDPEKAIHILMSSAHNSDDAIMKEQQKWTKIGMLIGLLLRVKKIKRFFLRFMELVDLRKLSLDKGDIYVAKKLAKIENAQRRKTMAGR